MNARVAGLRALTPGIREVVLDLPGWPGHRAGQHATLRLTALDGYEAKRDYSIASAWDGKGQIVLAIDLLPDGEVSSFVHDVLQVGDALDVLGPLGGHFVWEPRDGGPVLLVGGGSGVVPLVAMLRERASHAPEVPMALLLAARTWEDVAFRDDLLAMDEGPVSVRLLLSRDAPRRPQDRGGRIDAATLALAD